MSASRSSLPNQQAYAAASSAASSAYTTQRRTAQPRTMPRHSVRTVRSVHIKKGLPTLVYWFAIAAMCFCVFQCLRTIAMESYSLVARVNNEPIIERYYQQTVHENRVLQERIQNASSRQGIEAMARNYLNLTGEGEILVRLH